MGPKRHHKYPYKREEQESNRGGDAKPEAEPGVMRPPEAGRDSP